MNETTTLKRESDLKVVGSGFSLQRIVKAEQKSCGQLATKNFSIEFIQALKSSFQIIILALILAKSDQLLVFLLSKPISSWASWGILSSSKLCCCCSPTSIATSIALDLKMLFCHFDCSQILETKYVDFLQSSWIQILERDWIHYNFCFRAPFQLGIWKKTKWVHLVSRTWNIILSLLLVINLYHYLFYLFYSYWSTHICWQEFAISNYLGGI